MKYAVRILSIAVLVALLATPFVSFAQGDPRCNGLSEADCQIVLQAAENASGITSFSSPNFTFHLDLSMPDSETGEVQTIVVDASGHGSASFASPDEALVYLYLDEASVESDGTTQTVNDIEVILTPTMQYVKMNGEWYGGEEETDFSSLDMSSMDFNTLLDSMGIDLGTSVTTTRDADAELQGQQMAVFTTTVDIGQLLNALLASPAVGEALGMAGEGEDAMSPEEMQMVGALLAPMLAGTSIETAQWIGLDDNYVHRIIFNLALSLDMTMFAPEAGTITGALNVDAELADFNAPVSVEIPTEFKPLDEMESVIPALPGLGSSLGGGM